MDFNGHVKFYMHKHVFIFGEKKFFKLLKVFFKTSFKTTIVN